MFGVLFTMAGCSQPSTIIDTSGAVFGWRCKRGVCELEILDETPAARPCFGDYVPAYSYMSGRFIEVLSVCGRPGGGWSSSSGDGRYIACDDDHDCPQLDFMDEPALFECAAGLCQNTDEERYPRDEVTHGWALDLCIADLSRDESDGVLNQIEDLLTDHCGPEGADLCELPLPEPCWPI